MLWIGDLDKFMEEYLKKNKEELNDWRINK